MPGVNNQIADTVSFSLAGLQAVGSECTASSYLDPSGTSAGKAKVPGNFSTHNFHTGAVLFSSQWSTWPINTIYGLLVWQYLSALHKDASWSISCPFQTVRLTRFLECLQCLLSTHLWFPHHYLPGSDVRDLPASLGFVLLWFTMVLGYWCFGLGWGSEVPCHPCSRVPLFAKHLEKGFDWVVPEFQGCHGYLPVAKASGTLLPSKAPVPKLIYRWWV